jgi:hypothetical protein
MAAIFESHGQTGRAMEVYASMDQNDARVVKRQEEILTEAALKLQRTFRGKKAREEFERRRKTRRARRVYGSADGFTNVQTFTQGKDRGFLRWPEICLPRTALWTKTRGGVRNPSGARSFEIRYDITDSRRLRFRV